MHFCRFATLISAGFRLAFGGWLPLAAIAVISLLGLNTPVALAQATPQLSTDELRTRINDIQTLLGQLQAKLPALGPNVTLGGQVHGFVVAAIEQCGAACIVTNIFLPDAQVFLRNRLNGSLGPKVATNGQGYFVTPQTQSGPYDVCVEAQGFASACDGTPVQITRGTFVLDHNVLIRPSGSYLTGRVLLNDSAPCHQENSLFQTAVDTRLDLFDASNKPVVPSVRANSLGYYILPTGQATGQLQLRATCAGGQGSRNITIAQGGGIGPIDLAVASANPIILSLTAAAGGRMVRTAAPGDTLDVTVQAADPGGKPLHYKWADGLGSSIGMDAPLVHWKLPSNGATNFLFVEVTNGNGGYARERIAVRTGNRDSFISGTVIDRFTNAPLASASVTVNGKVMQTGIDGTFATSVPESGRYVINARKTGYALQSRIVYLPTLGLRITLDRAQRTTCDPGTICNIVAEGRGPPGGPGTLTRLQIPANTLVDESGRPATGPVNLDLIGYDVTQPNPIPGDFGAIAKDGHTVAMLTYGAASIDATDAAGRRYTLASGKTAHLSMLVQLPHLSPAPPASLPLWEYNEQTGNWEEKATATFNSSTRSYEGEIPGFSAWNADATFSNTACINIHVSVLEAPPFPFVLQALPTPQNNFQHTTFNLTDSEFFIHNLIANSDVDVEVHLDVQPDPGPLRTFHLNAGAAQAISGIPANPETDCHGFDKATNVPPVLKGEPVKGADFLTVPGINPSQAETNLYFQAVGAFDNNNQPTPSRGTFTSWKQTNGLSIDPKNPAPGEVVAVYFNNGDLQLGRDMHCLSQGGKTACYVTNYGSLQGDAQPAIADAEGKNNPVASVAMEYDPNLSDVGVRFYAFKGTDGSLFSNPVLDNEGNKFLPQNCMACHGGSYDPGVHNVRNATFLPFDINSFICDQNQNNGQCAGGPQVQQFRQLNAIIESTSPNALDTNNPIITLIDGWYNGCGGVNNANCTAVNDQYAPPSWSQNQQLYQTIPRVYCRTCHIAQGDNVTGYPDWTQFPEFNNASFLRFPVCVSRIMPHAEVPFKRFWFSTNPQAPVYLAGPINGINIQGGCPPSP